MELLVTPRRHYAVFILGSLLLLTFTTAIAADNCGATAYQDVITRTQALVIQEIPVWLGSEPAAAFNQYACVRLEFQIVDGHAVNIRVGGTSNSIGQDTLKVAQAALQDYQFIAPPVGHEQDIYSLILGLTKPDTIYAREIFDDKDSANLTAQDKADVYAIILQRILIHDDFLSNIPASFGKIYVDQELVVPPPESAMQAIVEYDESMHNVAESAHPLHAPSTAQRYPSGYDPPDVIMTTTTIEALKKSLDHSPFQFQFITDISNSRPPDKKTATEIVSRPRIWLSQIRFLSPTKIYTKGTVVHVGKGPAGADVFSTTYYVFDKSNDGWRLTRSIHKAGSLNPHPWLRG